MEPVGRTGSCPGCSSRLRRSSWRTGEERGDVGPVVVVHRTSDVHAVHIHSDRRTVGRNRAARRQRPPEHGEAVAGGRSTLRRRIERAKGFGRCRVVGGKPLRPQIRAQAFHVDRIGMKTERSVAACRAVVDQIRQHVGQDEEAPASPVVERVFGVGRFDVRSRAGDEAGGAHVDLRIGLAHDRVPVDVYSGHADIVDGPPGDWDRPCDVGHAVGRRIEIPAGRASRPIGVDPRADRDGERSARSSRPNGQCPVVGGTRGEGSSRDRDGNRRSSRAACR